MDMCIPGDGGGVASNVTGIDAFEETGFEDTGFEETVLSCDRLAFLLGRTSSSDDEFEREALGDMMPTVLLLLFDMADLEDFEVGTCMPREGRDSDLRRVSYGILLKGSEGIREARSYILRRRRKYREARLTGRIELKPRK